MVCLALSKSQKTCLTLDFACKKNNLVNFRVLKEIIDDMELFGNRNHDKNP